MADNMPDFDKMTPEEVMAWMESLAKRQGATEGFTTAADVEVAEIDPTTVEIDEPGYVPFGEEGSAKKSPAPSKPAAAPVQPAAAAETPPPSKPITPPVVPVVPAPPPPEPEPVIFPAASIPEPQMPLVQEEMEQDTQPTGELSGMAWLESLAADQGFDFPQIDLSALSSEIEPAPLQTTTPSNPLDWLGSITEEAAEAPAAETAQPETASGLEDFSDITDPLAAGIDPMLWLESLARRQGARSEELITPGNMEVPVPKDGVDTGPGYVDYTVEKDQSRSTAKAQPEPAAASDPNAWLASMAASPVEEEKTTGRMSDDQIRDALSRGTDISREDMEAFLDRQLTRQLEGADLPVPEDYDPNAPAVPAELPDWLMEQVQPPSAQTPIRPTTELPALLDQIVEPPAVQDLPDWLKEDVSTPDEIALENIFASEPEAATPVASQPPVLDANDPWVAAFSEEAELTGDKVPDWYQRNVNDPKRIAAVEGIARGTAELEEAPLPPETELTAGEPQSIPDWLSAASEDVSVPDWLVSEAAETPVAAAAPQEDIDLPDWLKEADVTVTADEIPDWLRETADTLEMVVSEPEPAQPTPEPQSFVAKVTTPAVPAYVSPAPVPVSAAVDVEATLKNARAKYSGGDLQGSLFEYESIIRANTALDAVISDVTRIVDQHKDNPAVYRVLGDGLMRQGKLQAALDTYRKALNQL